MKWTAMVMLAVALTGCTENIRAKKFGGEASEKLPCGRKVVAVTWKGDNLWILTRAMTSSDSVENYDFRENSSWGLLEGTVKIGECK